jgi:N-acylneuraminate cytidylyltransferase|tara:strand:- start:1968 stop:2672 length:705 start_codon:yes stop_codon:yes gene_type:complete
MRVVCFICARKGSKGLRNKNIDNICGKPLIVWSIEQAKNSKLVDEIVVSTDCDNIASVSRDNGAKVYFMRPDHLSDDESGKWQVWQHAITEYRKITGNDMDIFLDLDCTSPLRNVSDIDNAINLYISSNVDAVFSICEAKKNPYFNMVEYKNNILQLSKKLDSRIVRRQDAPKVYEHAASIYVISPNFLLKGTGLLDGNAIGYEMPNERCIDIDSNFDYRLVEFLMNSEGLADV